MSNTWDRLNAERAELVRIEQSIAMSHLQDKSQALHDTFVSER